MACEIAEVDHLGAVRPTVKGRQKFVELGAAHVDQADACAGAGERPRDRRTDPAGGAGHDDALALETW